MEELSVDQNHEKEKLRIIMEAFKGDAVIRYLRLPRILENFILRQHYIRYLKTPYAHISISGENNLPKGILVYDEPMDDTGDTDVKATSIGHFLNIATHGRYDKMVGFFHFMKKLENEEMPNKHIYIPYIGVDASQKRSGSGSELLRKLELVAKEKKLGIYLNTVDRNNIKFYEKNGFSMISNGKEPITGIEYWTFKKEHQIIIDKTQDQVGSVLGNRL